MSAREAGCMTTTRETPTAAPVDPRPLYRDALDWTAGRIAAVRPDQLALPTDCTEFDVRALLGHLLCTVRRATVVGNGGDPLVVPPVVVGVDDWAGSYRRAADEALAAWAEDARLDELRTAPWGSVPGRAAVSGHLNETLVHGHDLARATGQDAEAPARVAGPALAMAARVLPGDHRGEGIPFDPPVTPAVDAGPTERLANWSGRFTRPAGPSVAG